MERIAELTGEHRGVLRQGSTCDKTVWTQNHEGFGPLVEPRLEASGTIADHGDVGVVAAAPTQL